MQATAYNTRGACNRCGKVTAWVMGVAFQGDGTGRFRNLCARCERAEQCKPWYEQRIADLERQLAEMAALKARAEAAEAKVARLEDVIWQRGA